MGSVSAIGIGRAKIQEFLHIGGIDVTGPTCATGRRGLVGPSLKVKLSVSGF